MVDVVIGGFLWICMEFELLFSGGQQVWVFLKTKRGVEGVL